MPSVCRLGAAANKHNFSFGFLFALGTQSHGIIDAVGAPWPRIKPERESGFRQLQENSEATSLRDGECGSRCPHPELRRHYHRGESHEGPATPQKVNGLRAVA